MTYLNPEFLLQTFGVIGLFAIIFAESGLLIGFFFPGDSLLFTAGFLAPFLGVNAFLLAGGAAFFAIAGDTVGYWFGKKVGPAIFVKEDSVFFKKENVIKAQMFFEKFGAKAVLLARFVPVARTFVPILAGVGRMKYSTFIKWNIFGGLIWGAGVTLSGYYLGAIFPSSEKYLSYIVLAVVFISLIPIFVEVYRNYRKK